MTGSDTEPSAEIPWGASDATIGVLLSERARSDGTYVYCRYGDQALTIADLDRRSNQVANALAGLGVTRGTRVATMLANSIDHIALFFALLKLGACQIPVNIHLRGEGLHFILNNSECAWLFIEDETAAAVAGVISGLSGVKIVRRGALSASGGTDFQGLIAHQDASPVERTLDPDEAMFISYTSGTTGLPKGVLQSDRMLRTAAHGAARLGGIRDGDVLHMWEPFYHIGGSQVLVLALQHRATLAMVPRFSVSSFWDEVRSLSATHIHFLGGVIGLLLKQPESPADRDHNVRLAWGGGCPPQFWKAFEGRFGIPIKECYGMTETSSFATQNFSGKVGSIGKPLPWFDISIVGEDGREVAPGERGEIWIRAKVQGVLTRGYWRNPEATRAALSDGVLKTGDVARRDEDGDLFFLGRKKDSLRRRGENVSAFEVERIIGQHPDVEECAVIGVPNDLGDEDIKVFIRVKDGHALDRAEFAAWCEDKLAYFQVPRFIETITEFPKTPSLRIRKEELPRDTSRAFDAEAGGRKPRR